jgi:2-desacetyl-2-hydroxyethyl bacteriochlorophyllide A dehydrogenase
MKFKAAILTEIGKPLVVSEIETTELKVGQVLIKILMSGLCGAQLQELAGLKGNSKFVPHLLGHEGCGIVEEIGPGVTTVKVGDKVVMHWRKGDGIESDFPTYIYENKKMSSGKVTTISEYSVVSENRITTVPNDTPEELCALLGCGLTTALGVINNEADLKFGESVMIIGTGGVGLNLIQGASLANTYPIYAVDRTENKKELAISLGATRYINTNVEKMSDILLKEKVDVIIDTTGNVAVIEESLNYLSNKGRFILVGQPSPGEKIVIPNAYSLFDGNGKIIKATQGGKTNPTEDIPRYVNLQKSGKLSVDKLITHYFELEQINEAFELLKSGTAGRIMIKNK